MSLKTKLIPLDDKIAVLDVMIRSFRDSARAGNVEAADRYEVLKAVAADLDARRALPTSHTLGELRRKFDRVIQSKTALGYDEGQLTDLARFFMSRWPLISQALEQFGEESCE